MDFDACPGTIVVRNLESGEQHTKGGIILADDVGTSAGLKARWAQVHKVGKGVTEEIKPGLWILIPHGRWTRGITVDDVKLWMVDTPSVLCVSETEDKPELRATGQEAVTEYQYRADQFTDYAGGNFSM